MPLGPWIHQNQLKQEESPDAWRFQFEFPIFTNGRFLDKWKAKDAGIYIYNIITIQEQAPSLVVRLTDYSDPSTQLKERSDWDWFHNGGIGDEIAALVALLTGQTAYAGATIRRFERGKDPYGEPEYWAEAKSYPLEKPDIGSQQSNNINEIQDLLKIRHLSPENATGLIRSARLYQEAQLIANNAPEISWLFLVAAVETAANLWSSQTTSNFDKLKNRSDLFSILSSKLDNSELQKIADILSPVMGATNKFIKFVIKHLPSPPEKRPEFAQIGWDKRAMVNALSVIYNHRSKAVHAGIPFPSVISYIRPDRDTKGIPCEKPASLSSSHLGGHWEAAELPMYLHMFSYIVRGVLIKWFSSLLPAT